MKDYFDQQTDRHNTASSKWDQTKHLFGDQDVLPMWVADMDFMSPPAVIQALQKRAAHGIYGYTIRPQSYYDSIINWMNRRHQWEIPQDWIAHSPGVVTSLSILISTLTEPGDKVILQSPVYPPFYDVISRNDRVIEENQLVLENGSYRMDFETLARQLTDPLVKLLLLCSPHNPVGRVWTKDELRRVGELCIENDVKVISDEIHCDLVFRGYQHIPFASVDETFAQQSITCIAPTKTFNLAGLQTSSVIVADSEIRHRFNAKLKTLSIHEENYFAGIAAEAAYDQGEKWLEELLIYLEDNVTSATEFIAKHIPSVEVIRPEGTYLLWLDCRSLNMDTKKMKEALFKKAKLGVNMGISYGANGEGFIRVNIACPRALLEEGLLRLKKAFEI